MLPRFTACIAPFEPHNTSSSAGGSLTMVRIKSAALAASWGDFASVAPAATSSSAREAVRFQTVREWPALMRFMPMGRPIRPRPMNPIFLGAPADSKECLLKAAYAYRIHIQLKSGNDCSRIARRKWRIEIWSKRQAVFGRWGRGRRPGAPPAEAAAAALRGSSLDLEGWGWGESLVAFGASGAESLFAEAPESGFSSMRNKYW